jgi:hypothetical protein
VAESDRREPMTSSVTGRQLAKDFENLAETLATFVTLASIQLALRRQLPNRLTVSGVPSQRDGQGESQRSNLDVLAL